MHRVWLLITVLCAFAAFCAAQQPEGDPLVIDLDGKNFDGAFTDVRGGVTFDFFHPGEPVEIAWTAVSRNIGFLVLNRHGDKIPSNSKEASRMWFEILRNWKQQAKAGVPAEEPLSFHVTSSREMFGTLTNQPLSEAEGKQALAEAAEGKPWDPNGFRALAFFDRPENGGNANGVIDEGDVVYSHLRVWVDTAHNGRSEDGKMYTLAELGIKTISLNYTHSEKADSNGNCFRLVSNMGLIEGEKITPQIYDVNLRLIRNHPAPIW